MASPAGKFTNQPIKLTTIKLKYKGCSEKSVTNVWFYVMESQSLKTDKTCLFTHGQKYIFEMKLLVIKYIKSKHHLLFEFKIDKIFSMPLRTSSSLIILIN